MIKIIDYLEFRVTGEIKQEIFGELLGCAKGYKYVYDSDFFTILTCSYGFVGENVHKMKVKNDLLYSWSISDIIEEIKKSFVNIEKLEVSRIDIAYDFVYNKDIEYIKNIFKSRNVKRAKNYLYVSENFDSVETFYANKRGSDIYIRFYNKTKELVKSKKEYIKEYYKKNNLNGSVWRLEFQVNKKFSINDLNKVIDYDYLKFYFSIKNKNIKGLSIEYKEKSDYISICELKRAYNVLCKLEEQYGMVNITKNDLSIIIKKRYCEND